MGLRHTVRTHLVQNNPDACIRGLPGRLGTSEPAADMFRGFITDATAHLGNVRPEPFDVLVVDFARRTLIHRTARVSEWTRVLMVDHYLLLAGYENDTFVVVEPVMGFRTIKADTLRRYRKSFGDAAIVFSGSGEAAGRLTPSLVAAHAPAIDAAGPGG